ncbi:hypothetical protein [Salipiger mucosus]|uniref:Uncharacterized protein n=1 Tax=Salipiger mucosus DSM 16094 TaxID=1123237 RepID=S9QWS3_9RHOB|nr:hypothetical protein [Salipiger mucosus]EPX84053.1 hypothetical protein Salmuc_01828 [Salipiger mucosus DSM 16094]
MEIGKMRIEAFRAAMGLGEEFPENSDPDLRWDIPFEGGGEHRRLQVEAVEEDEQFLIQVTLDEWVEGVRTGRTLDFEAYYMPGVEQMPVFCDSEDNSPEDILEVISAAMDVRKVPAGV